MSDMQNEQAAEVATNVAVRKALIQTLVVAVG